MDTDAINLVLLLLRVIAGVTMAAHGYQKFFLGGRIAGTARWFESLGMRPGKFHALLAACTEIGSGMLFAAGLLTPLAAMAFVGLMFVAAWTHKEKGFYVFKEGWEYNLVLAAVAITVATLGPGEWSVDDALGINDDLDGWTGFAISLAGLAAAFGLLAVFWRPKPDTAT